MRAWSLAAAVLLTMTTATPAMAQTQGSIAYRLAFPEPEHRWMQVDVSFTGLPAAPLELHMSRSSPGRYALHEFAKNVFDLHVADAAGAALGVTHPSTNQWVVARHPAAVHVTYRVFGDRTDGTYLSVDTTHAHINMPASMMWARGLEDRRITVTFVPRSSFQVFRAATRRPSSRRTCST
jgi:predicted metalloprotease with PDZ domain